MAEIYHTEADPDGNPPMVYWDRTYYSNFELQVKTLQKSSTLYVGNLSFYTQETQIHELFSKVAPVKLITMGVNKATKTPCGFCFVE
jgi:nuclear cap-binding protein subunit 2